MYSWFGKRTMTGSDLKKIFSSSAVSQPRDIGSWKIKKGGNEIKKIVKGLDKQFFYITTEADTKIKDEAKAEAELNNEPYVEISDTTYIEKMEPSLIEISDTDIFEFADQDTVREFTNEMKAGKKRRTKRRKANKKRRSSNKLVKR